jgi:hypothetical protein
LQAQDLKNNNYFLNACGLPADLREKNVVQASRLYFKKEEERKLQMKNNH